MLQAIAHRGPDDGGVFVDESRSLYLGHRRLSILELSEAGHQPMKSSDGRFIISFNGEIYNHGQIRSELDKECPVKWRGHCDTEVAVEAIARWGIRRAVSRFNGMFAIVLFDTVSGVLYCIRDRLGVKPLYIGYSSGHLFFGSEIKCLAANDEFSPEISHESLQHFIAFGYSSCPDTVYANAMQLTPGSILEVYLKRGSLEWESLQRCAVGARGMPLDASAATWSHYTYWTAMQSFVGGGAFPFDGNFEEAVDHCDKLVRDAVRIRTVADVPIGVFLSGGIDSTLVAVLMQQQLSRPIKSFTIGFDEESYDESNYAGAIAKAIGTDHTLFTLKEADCLDVATQLPALQDEPLADSSFIPTYLVSKLARKHVTVALTGDGGDESFWGYWKYRHYQWVAPLYRYRGGQARILNALAHVLRHPPVPRGNIKWALYRLSKIVDLASGPTFLDAYYRSQVAYNAHCILRNIGGYKYPKADLSEALFPSLAGRMSLADIIGYLADDLNAKVDRASMRVSLESREPLLDYRVVEFGASLPPSMKISKTLGKKVLHSVLARYLDEGLFRRKKQGFSIPVEKWLRGRLRSWAEDVLFGRNANEGLFDGDAIKRLWRSHQTGNENHQQVLWNTIVLRNWLDNNRWC